MPGSTTASRWGYHVTAGALAILFLFPLLWSTWASVRTMLDVLGLDPFSPTWSGSGTSTDLHGVVGRLVEVALQERAEARTRTDWAAADRVRDALAAAGVLVEDTPTGPRWTLADHMTEETP